MKEITIIGANSYIARNLIKVLKMKKEEYRLWLYDIQDRHLDGWPEYQKVNVTDKNEIRNLVLKCDMIFVFTGKTGTMQGFLEFEPFMEANELALLNILRGYLEQKSKAKLIFPSTRLVYKGRKGALKEDAEKEFKTIYAINKYACEKYLEMYHRVFGVKYAIFRICLPYGTLVEGASAYGTADFFMRKVRNGENISLYGDGSQRRSLIYMGDLCDALISGAEAGECLNDVYNIGGEDFSLAEMAAMIAKAYGKEVAYTEWPEDALAIESGDTVFDSSKLDAIIGKKQSLKFEEWINQPK